jgi:hypothetical protein
LLGEMLLECGNELAVARIARGNGTAGTGIAAFQMNFADGEADYAAFVFAEELIFPEGRNAVDFESGAETAADVVEWETGRGSGWGDFGGAGNQVTVVLRKPISNRLQGSGGRDGWAVGDRIVREATFGIADDNLLLEKDAEPFGGFVVSVGESEGARGNLAAVGGNSESDGREVGGVGGANGVDGGSAFAVDPFAVDGIESPSAIEGKTAGWGDLGLQDGDGVEGFNGMQTDVGEIGFVKRRGHGKSLAGVGGEE